MRGRKVRELLLRMTAALCAALCLFSAMMTGTYAWESRQDVTNDLRGSADTLVSVVLEKLEKGTNAPVAGATFYLYREDGTQIGGRYVTNELGVICVQLGLGNYYFEEESPPLGYTFDVDDEGNAITRYPFTVTAQDMPISVLAYNIRRSGDLVISKTVRNSDGTALSEAQKAAVFTFTVSFSDGGTYDYTAGGETKRIASGDTLTLCHGESAVFADLPFGLLYDVTEAFVPGYTVAATGHRGNITDTTATAEFVNTWQGGGTGTLVVTKDVVGEKIDPETGENCAENESFTFTATIGGVQETFTLKHNEKKEFRDIALGTSYTVTEQRAEGYIANVEEYTGTVNAAETVTLPFVNTVCPVPPVGSGSLTITKTVTGVSGSCTDSFYFQVQFSGENAPEDTTVILNGLNGYQETIGAIPVGVSYTVTELLAQGYLPMWTQVVGTIHGDETAAFTNRAQQEPGLPDGEPVDITVTKKVVGDVLPSEMERTFHMTMFLDGKTVSFTLKNGESYTFEDVPYGAVYELREDDYITEGFAQSVTNGSGIATENTDIVVTNTYVGVPRVEISGKKTWVIPEGMSVALPESITVQLMDGTTVVEEKEIFPDENKDWLYTFTAPKYRADGVTEIEYAIMETPVAQFHMGYDPLNRYNLINTYIAPVIDNDPPVIIKEVRGVDAPVTGFTFVFTGKHGTPMPEGSTGYQKEILLNGSGEAEIGAITFTNAGTYVYTIHEKHGGEKGWTYDTALYTITYEVTEDPDTHQLSAARTITRNDRVVEELRFVNSYTAEDWEMVVISGVKTWVHRNNPVAKRPTSVIIEVYGDGKLAYMKSLTAEDGWRYSVELPKFADDGHTIVYTVDEQPVNGYCKSISGYNITNTYVGTTPGPTPGVPSEPDTPDKPDSSAPTGDNSRIPFWFMMTLASMLGSLTALCVLRGTRYEGKRVHMAKRLEKK